MRALSVLLTDFALAVGVAPLYAGGVGETVLEHVMSQPAPRLSRYVRRYFGYRFEGFEPGVHRAFASPGVTFMVGIGNPITSSNLPAGLSTVVSGPRLTPALIRNDGNQTGIDISLTPAGARALLGVPARALTGLSVSFDDLVGPFGVELWERIQSSESWTDRFAACDRVLTGLLRAETPRPELLWAWSLLHGDGGHSVAQVADDVGWTRQHLSRCFRQEFGVGPKQASRLVRFKRAAGLIRQHDGTLSLGDVASRCGYFDQSHLHREAEAFAGCTPSQLLDDNLPFIQDTKPAGI